MKSWDLAVRSRPPGGPLRVLQDLALFHDEEHAFGGGDIGGWISRHGNDVGKLARFQRPDLGGNAQKFGVDRCGRLEGRDGWHAKRGHEGKLLGIHPVR